ncbi:TonB-dependent receptor [Pedobacter sp. BMA]|uniref:TonB-dependent receptor n=1 Tax=Pedobacter sp. BMA TaxID=1663685 RepID=UPI000649DE61|nr:TonB-dependent receptor [Pedobacter sp. BMA]KLT64872.1 TonB-dependent receptor [Pedobacter sp. BMA]
MLKSKLFSLTFFLSIIALTSFAQQLATIKGKVTTSDGAPAPFISVGLKGKGIGNTSDENGNFTITRVKPGTYILKVSAVGLKSDEKNVTVSAGETLTINFSLVENSDQLKEVNINSERRNKFATKKSSYVAKIPLKNLENPQVYNTVSKELMLEQITTGFNAVLKNVPGIDKLWTSTGRGGDGAAYYSLRGFPTQVSMIDGIGGQTNGDVDPANIETVEVIKGPSGALYGGALTSFGGFINIVTKKPYDTLGGNFSYYTGSFGLNRLTADVNGPINKEKNLLFRINAAYNKQNSWQDAGFNKSTFLAPTLEYRVNDRLTFNLSADIYNYEGTNPTMIFLNRSRALIARTPAELNMDWSKSYTSNDLTIKTPTFNVRGQATYKLSDTWTSQTNFSQSNRKSDGYYQYVMFIGATDNLLNRYVNIQNSDTNTGNVQQNFIGDFKVGSVRNRVLIGLDYLNAETNNSNSPYILFDQVSTIGTPSNYASITRSAVDARIGATAGPAKTYTQTKIYSAYASDVVNITEALAAVLALRVDRFDNKGSYNIATGLTTGKFLQTAVSPKFGLTYNIIKDQVALFANYQNGFQNISPVIQPLADINGVFKPKQANQIEGGVKLDVFNNKVNLTASYYDIKVDNVTRPESITRNGIAYNITVQDGTQRNKGVDFSLNANPIEGLNLVAGYSYVDSRMIKATASVEGRRPVDAGPETTINGWISYTISKGNLNGLGLGFGGNYNSENRITNSLATGEFTLPAFTVLNATAFYNKNRYRIGVKIDNITDKLYYKGWTTVEAQMPRNLVANISYKF